ncbi:hypothetical protein [Acinetobacter baumannii]|uniref:hypothetical protein n=1 Tax=Acinetobacter baumannii TaxID=470 RepID=UPI00044E8A9D|nr:hypothetical protein [Acinetobacter baumannii]EXD52666.1 putative surface antigen [Acinetobacter baumannii 781407]EXE29543.1 putative surface antigen [Acinetobacter baumannii 1525283]OTS60764.1 hypothetical protein CAS98_15330 [Acinetobacter baumannii]TPS64918.1 hypothetical protein FJU46_15880 [Acinetobacter baumannii]HAV5295392.1 hypothetical protein [Acinetobacter baumannii]
MVNTKQSNSVGSHTTRKEPSSNGNVSNSKPLQDISSTIDNAHPDLNSPPINNNHVPDMNEGGENLVATGAGTLGGATVGAAFGVVGGPPGAVVGGIIGGVVGAIAGNDIAQTNNQKDDSNDWQEEDNYWRENYKKMPYYTENKKLEYDRDYRAAYRLGYENRVDNNAEINFSEVESKLKTKWEQVKGSSRLQWEEAKFAVEDGLKKIHP